MVKHNRVCVCVEIVTTNGTITSATMQCVLFVKSIYEYTKQHV